MKLLFILIVLLHFSAFTQKKMNPSSQHNFFLLKLENGVGINKSKSTIGTQFEHNLSWIHAVNLQYRRTFDKGVVLSTGVAIGFQNGRHYHIENSPFGGRMNGYNILMRHELLAGYDFLQKKRTRFIIQIGVGVMQHNTHVKSTSHESLNESFFYKKYPNRLIPYFVLSTEYGIPMKNSKALLLSASYNLSTNTIYQGSYRLNGGNEGRTWNSGSTFSIGVGLQF